MCSSDLRLLVDGRAVAFDDLDLASLAGRAGLQVVVDRLQVGGDDLRQRLTDAVETAYPVLKGTIRDHHTHQRRPFVRYFACERDWSHAPPSARLPAAVEAGTTPFLIVGALAGG